MNDLKKLKEEIIQHGYDLIKVRDEVIKLRPLLKDTYRFLPLAKGEIEKALNGSSGKVYSSCLRENLLIIDNLMEEIDERT